MGNINSNKISGRLVAPLICCWLKKALFLASRKMAWFFLVHFQALIKGNFGNGVFVNPTVDQGNPVVVVDVDDQERMRLNPNIRTKSNQETCRSLTWCTTSVSRRRSPATSQLANC